MLNSFRGLKPFQLSEYILLIAYAFVIPFSWRIATYVMIAIFVTTILRGIFEEGFKTNQAQYNNRFIYFISIAFWLIYAISFLYSENTFEARILIGRKLSFLLFPIFFLCSNLSYLNERRVRTILYFFVIGILTLFFVNLIWAGYDILFGDFKVHRLYDPYFLEKGTGSIHHTYISIYACLGVIFCFKELFSKTKPITKLFNIFAIISLISFTIISKSRAGLICIVLTFTIILIWLIFIKKKWGIGIYFGIIMLSVTISCSIVFKKSVSRVIETINNLQNIEREDRRIGIYKGYKDLLLDKFWFGVGAGDRSEETLKSYIRKKEEIISKIKPINNYTEDFNQKRIDCLESIWKTYQGTLNNNTFKYAEKKAEEYNCDYNSVRENIATYMNIEVAIKSNCNAHNQFSDTIIAVGVLGFILYIMMLSMPIYLWFKHRKFDILFFSLTFIMAFNSLFESVLERQMGIMFFVFFYFLLFHNIYCQQTNDNNQQNFVNLND